MIEINKTGKQHAVAIAAAQAALRMRLRIILPEVVLGRLSTYSTTRGYL